MAVKQVTTPTRISGDIVGAAAAVAAVEHRSATEQINHWARIGMQLERGVAHNYRQVLEVVTGAGQFAALSREEREAAHALIDADIARRVASERFGQARRSAGESTVSLDDDGNLIEIAADGTTRRL